MTYAPPEHPLPPAPPPEVLAALDAAAAALDALHRDGASLTLAAADDSRSLRIELVDAAGVRRLSATELFELLS